MKSQIFLLDRLSFDQLWPYHRCAIFRLIVTIVYFLHCRSGWSGARGDDGSVRRGDRLHQDNPCLQPTVATLPQKHEENRWPVTL